MATWDEIARSWEGKSACPGPLPEGNHLVGTLTRQAVDHRWTAYVAGVRQSGKTSFMLTMARVAAVHWSLPVTYVSTEFSTDALRAAVIAGLSAVSVHRVSRFDLWGNELIKVREAQEKLAAARLHLHGQDDLTVDHLVKHVECNHPLDQRGAVFVDGLRGIMGAERRRDPEFSVETLMSRGRVRSQSAFIASGWLHTNWAQIAERRGALPGWPDVPEPVEWTFPRLIALGRPGNGNVANLLAQSEGGGGDISGKVTVQGFRSRVVDVNP